MNTSKVCVVNQLTKIYAHNNKVLDDLSIEINKGEIVSIIGLNGSGKTTLFKVLSGLTTPSSGSVAIMDETRLVSLKKKTYLLLADNRQLYMKLTVKENISFCLALRKNKTRETMAKAYELLSSFGLSSKMNTIVQELSRGMQQKLSLCLALIDPAPLLLLDEPTLGLDYLGKDELLNILRLVPEQFNKSVLVSAHDLDFISKVSQRIYFINFGKIIAALSTCEYQEIFGIKNLIVEFKPPIKNEVIQMMSDDGFIIDEQIKAQSNELHFVKQVEDDTEAKLCISKIYSLGLDIKMLTYDLPPLEQLVRILENNTCGTKEK